MKRDLALIAGAFALCPLVAALAPSAAPLGHTRALVGAERTLGIYVEPAVHGWTREHPALLTLAGLFYIWVHFPATVGALVWARLERPQAFRAARDTFVLTQLITVAGYLLYPVAPPRMLPGFTDTLAVVYGSGGERLAHSVQSPYAAMPSGHVAFAAVAGGIVFALVRSRVLRALSVLYVMLVIAVIVSTANHLFLDAAGGLAAAGLGFLTARGRKQLIRGACARRREDDDGDFARTRPTGGRDRCRPGWAGGGAAAAGDGLRGDGPRAVPDAGRARGAAAHGWVHLGHGPVVDHDALGP